MKEVNKKRLRDLGFIEVSENKFKAEGYVLEKVGEEWGYSFKGNRIKYKKLSVLINAIESNLEQRIENLGFGYDIDNAEWRNEKGDIIFEEFESRNPEKQFCCRLYAESGYHATITAYSPLHLVDILEQLNNKD